MGKAEDNLSKARMNLVMKYPFFGILALKLKFISDPTGGGAGTMGVNIKKQLLYNPEFVESLPLRDVCIVLMHEIGHLVQSCEARFPLGGDRILWNIAADFAVNSWVCETELCTQKNILDDIFPKEIRPKYKNKSTEEIYLSLLKEGTPQVKCYWSKEGDQNDPGKHEANGLGCKGASNCTEEVSPQELQEIIRDIQSAAVAVSSRSEGRGTLPGFIQEFLAKLSRPTVTWKDYLRRVTTLTFKGKYSWHKPSRRSESIGMRLQNRKPIPEGAIVALDTSGSISDSMLNQFLSECMSIMKTSKAPWVEIYLHDTEVYHHGKFHKGNLSNMRVQRGGTSHIDVFEQIKKNHKKVGILIAFTDLQTQLPKEVPRYPVIWAVPSKDYKHAPKVSFGKTIEVKI